VTEEFQFTPRTDFVYSFQLSCGHVVNAEWRPGESSHNALFRWCPTHQVSAAVVKSWWPATPADIAVIP
jgi:hypothetical protein